MDRLGDIEVFVRVAEDGGFSAAARRLGMSTPMVSKRLSRLEDRLGARLLDRTTRRVSLTEAGEIYLTRAKALLDGAAEAEAAVSELSRSPRGRLRVSAGVTFGNRHLSRVMPDFLARYPDLAVELVLEDRYVDLVAGGFDLAVRIGRLEDSSLVARRVAASRRLVCAAPSYLDRAGRPARPAELARHAILRYVHDRQGNEWTFTGRDGGVESVRVQGRLEANNGEFLYETALRGLGIALMPEFLAAPALADGRLEIVLPDFEHGDDTVNVVRPAGAYTPLKARVFTDYLVDVFGGPAPWRPAG